MSNHQDTSDLHSQSGFTLVELLIVVAIIGTLAGMLLPAIQKAREAANADQAVRSLRLIGRAETDYNSNSSPHSFTDSLRDLGLDGLFPCIDPGCGTRQNGGYYFHITLGPGGQTFTAEATPAVVGKTGSERIITNQTGGIFTAALPEADSIHKQMFDHLNAAAVQTLLRLILQRPQDFPEITRRVESRGTTERAFHQLDVNGDGRVSFTDLHTYNGVGADAINPFIAIIDQELQLGAGGEDVSALPGVTLFSGGDPHSFGDLHTNQIDGLSDTEVNPLPDPSPTPARPPRTINLAGFGDGSVRTVNGDGDADDRQVERFNHASFFANLSPPDAATTNAWGGAWTFTDQTGNSVNGILIGLLQPSGGGQSLRALVITTDGAGAWFFINGNGDATINWGDQSFTGPFTARFRILPAIQRGKGN